MTDLHERLRQIERNPSPDLWDEITDRTVQSYANDRRGLRHRVAAGLVAAVVSLAAFAFLVTVFRSESDQGAVGTPSSPLTIRVRTTNDPFDVHFSATFRGEVIDLVGIETPGPDLEYPKSASAELPVGTPIDIEATEGISVSVFELDHAKGKFVVENGSCLVPGSLRVLPGPDETAFFIYAEGKGWGGGQAFRAETVGDELDHDSALDPGSTVDASKLGLAACEPDQAGTIALPPLPDSGIAAMWSRGENTIGVSFVAFDGDVAATVNNAIIFRPDAPPGPLVLVRGQNEYWMLDVARHELLRISEARANRAVTRGPGPPSTTLPNSADEWAWVRKSPDGPQLLGQYYQQVSECSKPVAMIEPSPGAGAVPVTGQPLGKVEPTLALGWVSPGRVAVAVALGPCGGPKEIADGVYIFDGTGTYEPLSVPNGSYSFHMWSAP